VKAPALAIFRCVGSRALIALVAGAALWLAAVPAQALEIERIRSPRGIEAWLVREPAVPVIAVEVAFVGGSSQDPEDKPGVANMAVSLLDEGAGPLDAQAFQQRLESKAIELSFRAGHDYVRGTLRTLKENRDEAFDYLRLAMTAPRFDAPAVERIRAQILSQLQRASTSPSDIAKRNWWATAFPGHPYGRPVNGTLDSVSKIGIDDLKAFVQRNFARGMLKIAIVGDIDAATAGRLLDRTFGDLPAQAELVPVADVTPQGIRRRIVVPLDVPQAVMTFGGPGLLRSDPDFMAAYIVNHILGGGSFSSRLYREVREKRGLAYGIHQSLVWFNHASVLVGGTATRADKTGQTIEVIESEMKRMAEDGPTEAELVKAQTYLKGAFALGLDTSVKIASQLIQMQVDNLGIDYIQRRPAMIDAVTLADVRRVAKRLLEAGMLVTVVGRPEGVSSKEGG
jgi:zinc protease